MYALAVDDKEAPLIETPGARIKRARIERGLSEMQLAAAVGISKAAIVAQEAAGTENFPKLPNALKIAKVLGVSPWYIAFGKEETEVMPGVVHSAGAVSVSGSGLASQADLQSAEAEMRKNYKALGERLQKIEAALKKLLPD